MERWIIPALLISLGLHIAFTFLAKHVHFTQSLPEKITLTEEPSFQVEDVIVNPKTSEPEKESHIASLPQPVNLPTEKPEMGKRQADLPGPEGAPLVSKQLLSEKPEVSDLARNAIPVFPAVEQRANSLEKELIKQKPDVASQGNQGDITALQAEAVTRQQSATGGKVPGFSNLDDLLAQTGPLQSQTAPILMPTDVLFDYDKDMLRDVAVGSMQKLGALIQRNPKATFLIEGHTDSYGSDEYNKELSRRRAESVKAWLVKTMSIDPNRIETRGFGKSRLIAPASGTVEMQQINRRVEIVIHAN